MGGYTLDLKGIIRDAAEASTEGKAVILYPPADRFSNECTFNMLINKDGSFRCEYVGPGYDSCDLKKGGIYGEWEAIGFLGHYNDIVITKKNSEIENEVRLNTRLKLLTDNVFPKMGIETNGDVTITEKWLKDNERCGIWKPDREPDITEFRKVLYETSKFYEYLQFTCHKNWKSIVLPYSRLKLLNGEEKSIFWEMVTPDFWPIQQEYIPRQILEEKQSHQH